MDTLLTTAATFADLMPIAGWDGDGPGWWIVLWPLLWIAIIVGVVWLVRGGRRGGPPWAGQGRETAIEVLERRFAEGELSLEQYRERRSVLEEER